MEQVVWCAIQHAVNSPQEGREGLIEKTYHYAGCGQRHGINAVSALVAPGVGHVSVVAEAVTDEHVESVFVIAHVSHFLVLLGKNHSQLWREVWFGRLRCMPSANLPSIYALEPRASGETRLKAMLPLDGHISEGQMAFLAEVKVQEEKNRPGHGGEKATIAKVAQSNAAHGNASILGWPLSGPR